MRFKCFTLYKCIVRKRGQRVHIVNGGTVVRDEKMTREKSYCTSSTLGKRSIKNKIWYHVVLFCFFFFTGTLNSLVRETSSIHVCRSPTFLSVAAFSTFYTYLFRFYFPLHTSHWTIVIISSWHFAFSH